jgi:hypothetical protein
MSRLAFLSQIIDRKLLAREMKRQKRFGITLAESLEIERMRETMTQNELFSEVVGKVPEPTQDMLDLHRRRATTLAEVRFIAFTDWDRARAWQHRLSTGTPLSALEAAITREGPALATADSFRTVAAEQIPDTLAQVIWSMRVGQVSDVLSFAGTPSIVVLRTFTNRQSTLGSDPATLRMDWIRRYMDRARELYRLDLVQRVERRFDEDGMAFLLAAHMKVTGRTDVDSITGVPVFRPNLALPVIGPADTARVIARTKDRTYTMGDYIRYWSYVSPVTRPEVRERLQLEGAVDRVVLVPEILRQARARGLDKDPRLLAELDQMREGYQMDRYYREEFEAKVKVTESALRKAWSADPAHYNDRASIESRIILVDRQSLADSLLARLKNGASFSDLAREYSNDAASGAKGGVVGRQYKGTQENVGLEDAMFNTPVGQLGGPEKVPQGWVIWRVDSALPGVERTFEAAEALVERDYRVIEADKALRAKLDELRKKAHVQIYEDRMTAQLGQGGPWD